MWQITDTDLGKADAQHIGGHPLDGLLQAGDPLGTFRPPKVGHNSQPGSCQHRGVHSIGECNRDLTAQVTGVAQKDVALKHLQGGLDASDSFAQWPGLLHGTIYALPTRSVLHGVVVL